MTLRDEAAALSAGGFDEPEDWIESLVAAIPRASRVLVMGAFPRTLLDALRRRRCQVSFTGDAGRMGPTSAPRDAVVSGDGAALDAILVPALYGPAINRVLAAACPLLSAEGRVVALVRNAAYAGHRLAMLRGRMRQVDVAALLLPLDAAESLLADAGLAVVERIPVTRPLEVDAPPAVREELLAHPDALAWAHVVVAVPAAVAAPPDDETMAPLRRRISDLTRRIAELETALADRIGELDAVHDERRHLELDVAVKDAFIGELLEKLSSTEVRLAEVDAHLAAREAWFAEVRQMTRHQLADALHARISAVPPLHLPLRAAARWRHDRAGRNAHRG